MPGPDPPIASPPRPDAARGAADEAELLRRLQAGEDAAYELLVRTLTPRLLAVARRIARTEQDAEDAVQEAFLSAFKSIGDFDGRSTLGTWLHRIAVNAALQRARKQARRNETSIDALLPTFKPSGRYADPPVAWAPVTDDADARIQQQDAIRRALDQLPEEFRAVVVLRDIEGLESKAVAASLGISDGLVRQRLHRARQALVQILNPMMTEAKP
jgi:RNA polymerase sigma-70 factor (ECF subfamily)